MGGQVTHLERSLGENLPSSEHYLGLTNFGNSCYVNSVVQALYFCRPFRKHVLEHQRTEGEPDTLLSVLAELFDQIASSRRKFGILQPKKFVTKVKKENVLFDNMQQQDAHEFLNYLLNTIGDLVAARQREAGQPGNQTWVQEIFQGTLTNETRCLVCETVRSKDEDFLDLSVDIEQNTSLTHCLKVFSAHERLCSESKYYCEQCCSKQEATKRLRVKKLPVILALHLKRFKYVEQFNKFVKLSHRVAFPWELKLFNISGDAENTDHMYDLIAVVVHCGTGPNRGHYITIVKSHGFWLIYDDDIVEEIEPHEIENYFGLTDAQQLQRTGASESGYILFYERRNQT